MTEQNSQIKNANIKIISGAAIVVGMAGIGLLLFIFIATQGIRGLVSHESKNKEISQGTEQIRALHERENTALSQYRWIDKSAGQIQIPIERAMSLVILQAHKRGSSQRAPLD